MFSWFKKNKNHSAWVNHHAVPVAARETLLQAGLRAGLDMPYSCRVGGCGTCKCKLVDGKVRQLTDFSYVLSEQEMQQGYILACQSVPLGEIRVEAVLDRPLAAAQQVGGRVLAQQRLTHDITLLRVRLDDSLRYLAGQYVELSVASLPGVARNYSFATAPSHDGIAEFFVRRVPGGLFSAHINDQQLVGEAVSLRGPLGDFHLHPGTGPLLMVAGGSGLAPIRAILQDAAAQGLTRPVRVLFGARRQQDLYLLDELEQLARQWPAAFSVLPVLSEPGDDDWTGARGLITEHFGAVSADTDAYLCGPPVMVDAASDVLRQQGIDPARIHADRFLTQPLAAAV